MTKQDIGEAIWNERVAKGLSQAKLAQKGKIRKNYVLEIERGLTNYSIDALLALLDALNLDISVGNIKSSGRFDFAQVSSKIE